MADAAQTRPIEDVQDISAITYGFMASKALFSALEFDVFTRIAQGADSTSALAKVTGIAENRLLTLLAALKSLGLISEAGGRLINAPATSRYLVAGAPGDFRDYVRFVNGAFGYEAFAISTWRCAASGFSRTRASTKASSTKRDWRRKVQLRSAYRFARPRPAHGQTGRSEGSPETARRRRRQWGLQHRVLRRQSATLGDDPRFPRDRRYGQAICARGRARRSDRESRGQRGRRRLAGGTRRRPHVLRLERSRRG